MNGFHDLKDSVSESHLRRRKQRRSQRQRRLLFEGLENRSLLAGDFGFINAMGGTSVDFARSVVIDAAGNSYVTGEFRGTVNFNPQGTFNLTTAPPTGGVPDCFIAKYSPTGAFLWAKQIGNTGNDWGNDIALDPSGNVYVAGVFTGTVDFNPDPVATANRTAPGANGAFLLKLDPNGNYLSVGAFGPIGPTPFTISVDTSGNVYTTGQYSGTVDFDPTLAGTSNLSSTGGTFDVFLTKISPSGSLLWARGFGGTSVGGGNGDVSNDVAVDASGNAYVTGRFAGAVDFDPGPGVTSVTSVGLDDMFISKFDTSGNFVWVRVQAGTAESQALGIAIDNDGNVVTTGELQSTIDFDPGIGQVNLTAPSGFYGAFVSKLDAQGNYLWAKKLGGPGGANAFALAIDNNGDIYTTGQFSGIGDFDPSSFPANMTATGSIDVYVSRLDKGGRFVDARRLGGAGLDRGRAIAIDPLTKAIHTAGQFAGTADFDPGTGTVNRTSFSSPPDDIFLSKLIQSDISGRVWNDLNQNGLQDGGEPGISGARLEVVAAIDGVFGNNDDRAIGDLVSDASGNFRFTVPHAAAYALRVYPPTGDGKGYRFTSVNAGNDNFDSDVSVSDGTILFTNTAGQSITNFGAGLVEVFSNVELALSIGGPGEQRGRSVAIDAAGNIYVAGTFTTDSIDLDPGPGAFILTNRGVDDGFVAKYTAEGDFLWAKGLGSTLADSIAGVAVDSAGNVFVAGNNSTSAYFGPGSGETILSSNGQRDLFVAKLSSAGSILWAQRVGSSGDDGASALALDGSGDVYVTGSVNGLVDFDPGPGVIQPPVGTLNSDSFVWKLSTSGAALWAVRTAGIGTDVGNSIVVAGSSVYVTGQFQSTVDFDPSAATVNRISAGSNDAFLWQLSTANGTYQNSYATGAAGNDFGTGITADGAGNIYLTGTFENTVDFNPSPTLTAFQTATFSDVFVTKSTGAGSLLWAKTASGGGVDVSGGIAVDQSGNAWMTGRFVGTVDFDPSLASLLLSTTSGSADSFVWGLDAQGNVLKAYRLGGAGFDSGAAVVVTPSGDRVYSTGEFAQQADFDPKLGLINLISFATASPVSTQNAYLWVLGLNDEPSSINLSGQTVIEQSINGTLIGNLTAIDPNPGDSHTFTLLDSAGGRFAILGSQLVVADGALLDYEMQSSHVITIRATDALGASFVKSFTITVLNRNEAPLVFLGSDQTANEGSLVSSAGLFTDPDSPDSWSATVDYGAGSGPQPLSLQPDKTFALAHVYADNGSYTVTVTVTDAGGLTSSDSRIVVVANVVPNIDSLFATSVEENGTAHLTGTYSDAGTQDTHTLTINWGEGAPQTIVVAGGSFDITHQYLDDNPTGTLSDVYTITGTLTDDDGGSINLSGSSFYATSDASTLVSIDRNTGVATTIGSFGYQSSFTGAFTPDGRFWTIVNSSFAGQLAEVNLTTGEATPLGAPPVGNDWIISLDANPAGQLFAGGHSGTYYSVNTSTGEFTPVGFGIYTCDFAFDTGGNLWAVDGSFNLHQLDPTTGALLSTQQMTGIADMTMSIQVDASNTFYVATFSFPSQLYRLDPATGATTLVGTNLGANFVHGGDFFDGAPLSVTVNNVAPSDVNISLSETTINENDSITLSGSFFDPGTLDTHTVTINWGDGSPNTELNLAAGVLSIPATAHQYLDDNPTNSSSDTYPISVTVTDDDGGSTNFSGASSFYATSELGNNLVSIDRNAGVATTVGSLGYQSSWTGAFTPDGHFWTIINSSFAGQLAEVNLTTGEATPVGAPPVINDWIISLDANPAGQLFAGGHSGTYYSVNTTTGEFTPVGSGIYTCDFAFDTSGNLWAVDGSFSLHQLDPSTGALLGTQQMTGLADMTMSIQVDASNTFYVATFAPSAQLYRLDPATGAATLAGTNLGVNYIHGGDFFDGAPLSVTVNNMAPVIGSLAASSVNENGTVHLTGTYSDVGTQDTHTLTINWGEGAPQTVVVSGGSFDITHQYLDDNPTGTASDTYTIGVTLTDDDTGTDTGSTTTTISNVAAVISSLSATSVSENGTVHLTGTYSDVGIQDTHTLTINWGEGAPQTVVVSGGSFDITHQYLDDNPTGTASDIYTIGVILTDDDTGTTTGSATTTITNVAPVVAPLVGPNPEPGGFSGVRGETLPFTVSFSDIGSLDTHQVQWDFGDGTVIPFTPTTTSGALSPTHIYTQNGTYTLTVTVRDDDGGLGTLSYQISIGTFGLQADPCDSSGTALVVGGTSHADVIRILPGDSGGLKVMFNSSSLGVFTGLSRVIVYGQAGDDDIQAAGSIGVDMWFFGDDGSDKLKGGAGNDVLLGGAGNDQVFGHQGRDLLVGGSGADQLVGNADDDILIAGNINFADQIAALCAIMDEWTSARSFSQRIDNLVHGTSSDRANGNVLLRKGTTVVDDSDVDQLTGASGSNWFFFSDAEDTANLHSDDVFGDLEWL